MTAPPDLPRSHVIQFDGLRGCAVLLVLAEHFTFNDWVRSWSPGSIGVRTFFVLSGFLITGILLSDRERFRPAVIAARFFRNRALRLLPPFLVAIALAAALGIADMRADWPWHLTYLSNLQVMLERRWTGAGHFWTLAVEQQFYLIWFPVVVLLPRRWLPPLCLICILGGPMFRGLIVGGETEFMNVLFPAQMDALALGAMMAMLMRHPKGGPIIARLGKGWLMWGLIALLALSSAPLPVGKPETLVWVLHPLIASLMAVSVLAVALGGPHRLPLLAHPALVSLGRISYGVYVFHYFVPQALNLHVPLIADLTEGPEKLIRLVIWIGLSVLLAAASWRWIEQPCLRLKAGVVWRKGPVPDPSGMQAKRAVQPDAPGPSARRFTRRHSASSAK